MEVLMDTKEGPKAPLATPVSFSQGKEMTATGAHAFSGSSNKCLSDEEGKKKDVGRSHSCCAGYLSVDGRGSLLNQIELLHVELIKCMEQLKSCRCCPQHYRQGDFGPRRQEATKEAQVNSVDMGKDPEEGTWAVKEKRNRRIKEKGMLPRPTSSWVAGRTGFGPMGLRKSTGQTMIEGGPSGLVMRLGRKETSPTHEPKIADKPITQPTGAQTMLVE
jgi:hypothetical protein